MDSQTKAMDGVESGIKERGGERTTNTTTFLFLRVVALVLSLAAAIVLGVNKQSDVIPIKLVDSLPPLNIPVSAKWHHLSAFVFFVVSNVIACSYAAISLLFCFCGKKSIGAIIIILDLLMVALLFSSIGAATAIGVMGYKGNSHVRWNKVCNVFGRFCNQGVAAIVLSLIGSIAFLLLVMLRALSLREKSK